MKDLVKKVLKEEELKVEEFFVLTCKENGREKAIEFVDNSGHDAGGGVNIGNDYNLLYLVLHDLTNIKHSQLVDISYPSAERLEHIKNTYLDMFTYYDEEYGDYTQDELTSYYVDEDGNPQNRGYQHKKNPKYNEWVQYSDFNVADNKSDIRILEGEVNIVEFHVSIIRADNTKNLMSQLKNG